MNIKDLVKKWFEVWEKGNFEDIPVTDDFRHTSPYGTIEGKPAYMDLVNANREKFLDHRFEIYDELYDTDRACVRYTARQKDFSLDVSEWLYMRDGKLCEIVAYYNIEGRELEGMDH